MQTKKEYKNFSIFEHEKEQDYLREQGKAGWRFVRVSGLGVYHFKKCEPEDVIYQLDYNKEGLANKEEYIQMYVDCGWEHMQEYFGYSYFRKNASDMKEGEEIFGDVESKKEMILRVYRTRLSVTAAVFAIVLLPVFVMNLLVMKDPAITLVYGVLIGLYLLLFAKAIHKYLSYDKQA